MRSIKRLTFLGSSVCLLALAGAAAWASPANQAPATPTATQTQEQPQQDQSKKVTFTGTIVKEGDQFDLREASGRVFRLDNSELAQPF